MIRSHIGSTQECGIVLKLERFSHLSGRSFGLGSPVVFEALSGRFMECDKEGWLEFVVMINLPICDGWRIKFWHDVWCKDS